ncbi:unnamed protein product [Colletotrichum noveboracense]|uniref:Uncharacterized protein n=1 Tax=Colletotrichum noveboracense TaxID=2664923 RepID=A0A9W4RN42_9PEZI|nr:unnamed protein product [Colletotrichum noveboracense]
MVEGAYYPFDMKEVLGCYDPECTMDNVQPSGFLGPTILSTLPEETVEAQAYRRIIARANMRWAGIENMRFDVIGSYIGHVKFVGPWILLRGQDEASFQRSGMHYPIVPKRCDDK